MSQLEHYVTLFDSAFLPQGLALHSSMRRNAGEFTLWILCMDDEVKTKLDSLEISTIRTIAVREIETPELLAVKPGRNRAEYCWTLTPFTPKIVFDRDPEVQRVTYVDSDVFLLKSPRPIFEEFETSGKAVMITDHGYDPEYDESATSGQYCVQFMIFTRDASEPVRQWWQDRCIEWCFDRSEDGKLGDQKYLDDWPTRFAKQVHVLAQLDLLLAPWNARRFPYSRAIAWHFHGFRLLANNRILLHRAYQVPQVVDRMVYLPYMREIKNSLDIIGKPVVQKVVNRGVTVRAKLFGKNLLRLFRDISQYDVVRSLPK
jgi:hypothetical protein